MKVKRILAALLSVAMLVGIFPMAALAEFYIGDKNDGKVLKTDTTATNIPTISFRLLDTSFKETTIDAVKTLVYSEEKDDYVYPKFYIEMIAKNFTQFIKNEAVIDKDGITQSGGLTNLVVKMQVNSDYLDIEPTAGGFDESIVKTRIRTNGKGHLTKTGNNGPATGEAYKSTLTYTKRTGAAQVTYQPYDSDPTYADAMQAEETLLIMEVQLKQTTDDSLKVFSVPDDTGSIQLGFGKDNADQWSWKEASHLETYLDLDQTGINFFPQMYTVTYKNGEEEVSTESVAENCKAENIPDGLELQAPDGEFFDDWYYDESGNNDFDSAKTVFTTDVKITGDTTVFAKFVPGHTVIFNSNYRDDMDPKPEATTKSITIAPKEDQEIDESKKLTAGDFTAPAGWSVAGWYTEPSCTNEFIFKTETTEGTKIDGTKEEPTMLYAKWVQEVTYTFDLNYPDAPEATTVTKTAGEQLGTDAPENPTRGTYDFKEWNTKPNGSGTKIDPIAEFSSTKDETLYAIWEPKADQATYTLTFNGVGGNLNAPTSIKVVQGDPITADMMPDDPTKTSEAGNPYVFEGWFKDASPSNTEEITAPIVLEEDTIAYAHWSFDEENADAITITFDDQSATTPVNPSTIVIGAGDAIGALPTDPEKTGNSFSGWFTSTDESGTKVETTTTFEENTTVYAKWVKDITVKFDVNTGTGNVADQTGKPTENLTLPADNTVTKDEYKLVGWNTEKNGSGTYAVSTMTLDDIYAARSANETVEGVVTLYAQWAYVPDTTKPDDEGEIDVTPKNDGVHVKFDSNAAGNKTGEVVNAKPKDKYPKYGEAIGTEQMPTPPTRTHYKFVGWNTKQNGSGVTVDGTTEFKTEILGDALAEIADTNTAYEITVYAQWELDTENVAAADTVKVILNANTSGKGDEGAPFKEISLYKGDALGYVPEGPTSTTSSFVAWYTEQSKNGDGYIVFGSQLKADTEINETVTYYAKWKTYIALILHKDSEDDKPEDKFQYTGEVITPEYDVYYVNVKDESEYELLERITDIDLDDFDIIYEKDGDETEFKNAGTYSVDADLKATSDLYKQGVLVAGVRPTDLTIKPIAVKVKVNPDTQTQKKVTNTPKATISVEGILPIDTSSIDTSGWFKYNIWDDKDNGNNDGNIQENELSEATGELAIGTYVIKAKSTSENYTIGTVESSTEQQVHFYDRTPSADGKTPGYPDAFEEDTDHPGSFKLKAVGQNIFFEVIPSDPSISSIEVKTQDKNGNNETPLALKQSDYTTDQEFDNKEEPNVTDYYARIPAPTEEEEEAGTAPDKIQFTINLTNKDTTTLTASNGETNPDKQVTVTKNEDGSYTVTAPINSKGKTPNTITITTKSGEADDAPTIEYTFNIQQLVRARIELNYGNSPYGEIMRDAAITDKDTAKAEFNKTHKYAADYTPAGLSDRFEITYRAEAWIGPYSQIVDTILPTSAEDAEKIADPAINMDRNETAIFAYQNKKFADTGFTAINSLGEDVTDQVVRNIEIKRIKGYDIDYIPTEDDKYPFTFTKDSGYDLSSIAAEIGPGGSADVVRPDIYDLEYTFTDIDGNSVKETRKIIILPELGDLNMKDGVDTNDTIAVYAHDKKAKMIATVEDIKNIYIYRVADTNMKDEVDTNDTIAIYAHDKKAKSIVNLYRLTEAPSGN